MQVGSSKISFGHGSAPGPFTWRKYYDNCDQLISIAKQEVGYLEKKSDRELDSKTANAGRSNYIKYARDLYPTLQEQL